ncbi:unnamed protein product [Ixodes hexagonus]
MWSLKRLVTLLVVAGLFAATASQNNDTIDPELLEIDEIHSKMFRDIAQRLVQQYMPLFSEIIYDPKLSTTCASALDRRLREASIGVAVRSISRLRELRRVSGRQTSARLLPGAILHGAP